MPNQKQRVQMVPICVMRLIDAFCRRDLSTREIQFITELFIHLSKEANHNEDQFFEAIDHFLKTAHGGLSQVVTLAPTESAFHETKGSQESLD